MHDARRAAFPAVARSSAVTAGTALALILVSPACAKLEEQREPVGSAEVSGVISGLVTGGVRVSLAGPVSRATTTGPSGGFSFTALPDGQYTLTPSAPGLVFSPQESTATLRGADVFRQDFTSTGAYSASGMVRGRIGQGVTITLSGPVAATTVTAPDGGFTFSGLPNGTYQIIPTRPGFIFSPASDTFTISNGPPSVREFTSSGAYSVSGRVTGLSVGGVAITLSGPIDAVTTTDLGGGYTFPGLIEGTYTVTPSVAGYVFSPPSRATAVGPASALGQDFQSSGAFGLSGSVSGLTTAGVSVSLSGPVTAQTATDGAGTYGFGGLPPGAYAITPVRKGYVFTPPSIAVVVGESSVGGLDFVDTGAYRISGTVAGLVASGVRVDLTGLVSASTVTSQDGEYSFAGLPDGSFVVTPHLAGYVFTPASYSISVDGQSVVGLAFGDTGAYAIAGRIGGYAPAGVKVSLAGPLSAVVSSAVDGRYHFSGLPGGSYTVTPSLSGYAFSPATLPVTVTDASVNAVDFGQTPLPPEITLVRVDPTTLYPKQVIVAQADARSPAGLGITYSWSFGDTTSAAGPTAKHAFSREGAYQVQLTATDEAGQAATRQVSVSVLAPVMPAMPDNVFEPYCSGPLCGAADAATYSGAGIGLWRYHNATASEAVVPLTLLGVQPGNRVALILTNGASTATSLPALGSAAQAPPEALPEGSADPHSVTLEENERVMRRVLAEGSLYGAFGSRLSGSPALARVPPTLGTERVWIDNFSLATGATEYRATVEGVCTLPSGRNGVFWGSPGLFSTPSARAFLDSLISAYCGELGLHGQLTSVLGDVWGPAANPNPLLIHDDALGLLDVNVVFVVAPGAPWGGYFNSVNAVLKSSDPRSNEALMFMMNGTALGEVDSTANALLHETAHMLNTYQHAVSRQAVHNRWLEETSAMMAQDYFSPTVRIGPDFITGQTSSYLGTGGAVSLINWPVLSGPHYNMGGAVGGFLNRRYGIPLLRGLVESCDEALWGNSYACVDALIRALGGVGFGDELARFGTSVFGGLPARGVPWGFGFPETLADRFTLLPGDVSAATASRLPQGATLGPTFGATSHTYLVHTIPAGQTRYENTGVVVPPGVTLTVAIPEGVCEVGAVRRRVLHECETDTATVCGTWTWNGTTYDAAWTNGAIGRITVEQWDATDVVLARRDLNGFTAQYAGKVQPCGLNGSVLWAGNARPGRWTVTW